ncbi:MAG: c-type cytochrome [Deltaproteobacteria bacterium]|nr:c-type cytochrome [Deltaproteobacteria bacterium]
MLSRYQARSFFLIGTAVMTVVFIGLTVDTFRQIPVITNEAEMSASVIRGKHLWDVNNCMGCHTLLGEGGYYAPELTKAYERRGEPFIRAMLKDPEAMYPGERKMQQYDLTEEQITDLVEFLKWIGTMDLQGFPPVPKLVSLAVPAGDKPVAQRTTQPKIYNQMCIACHALNGQGGTIGPALDGVGNRKTKEEIEIWLTDPLKVKPDSKMPKLPLTNEDIKELGAYLSQLKS